ncbi:MAG TPA: cupin domain-containing protein [Pontiella sp.]
MIYQVGSGEVVYNQGGCVGRKVYEAFGNEYVHLAIEPGGLIPEHALPLAVSFCVLKGQGVCRVAGEELLVSTGIMIECPPATQRSWRNESDDPVEILVIKRSAE